MASPPLLWALNFGCSINTRRLKKRLRNLEASLGKDLRLFSANFASGDFRSRLDLWVSYYITALIQANDMPKDLWCDGTVWRKSRHLMNFKEISDGYYGLECELDLMDDGGSCDGHLEARFEYNPEFTKFMKYEIVWSVDGKKYIHASKSQ